MQFLNAVSHSVGDSNALCDIENAPVSDDETDGDAEPQEQQTQPSVTQPDDHAEMCEVCHGTHG